ncbi:glycoside hydrolase family 30 protein [candidate division KSB1 bacterium]|nr:glycoside hydrolase family 30 protein [candidate division KSB1 bacterium]
MKPILAAILFILPVIFLACVAKKPEGQATGTKIMPADKVRIFETAKSNDHRLKEIGFAEFEEFGQPLETQACIFIDPRRTFQTIVGIGGALTDASAETFAGLSEEKQQELLTAYFDAEKGIGYTLARTNIQSCDFSSGSYEYVERDDFSLNSFSIDHDKAFRIPFIKKAMAAADGHLTLYASPWSPPAWMKTNYNMLRGGKLKPDCAQAWAQCFVKFIQAYEAEGVPVWGISVQNEPMATQTWESCIYTAEEERDFVRNHLGPALHRAGLADKKLIIWDHNRDLIYQRASTVLHDPEAAQYVWGVGFHWYMQDAFENVKRVHEAFPQVNLIFTEGCNYPYSTEHLIDWHWGENYGRSMVHDFNNGAVGWTDWNVLLDEQGGPNHVGNYCLAPVHRTADGDLYYMNSFYYLGHFSKFVRPGAKRIISSSNRDRLLTTAFVNPDGRIAVIVLNLSGEAMPFKLWLAGRAASCESRAHSILTLVV